MTVKTITVTEAAYNALSGMKKANESFSEVILRIRARRSLRDFLGVLSVESGDSLEDAILAGRERRQKSHELRVRRIKSDLAGA